MPEVGEVVDGRYRLERRLGDGVFLAEDQSLARSVAVRVSGPEDAPDLALQATMLRSLQFASLYVVPVLDEGATAEGGRYFVSPYVEGVPLSRLEALGAPLPADQVAAIGEGLLEAAEAARRIVPIGQGAVPRAAILDRDGQVRVTRFALDTPGDAAVLRSVATTMERLAGRDVPDPLADVFGAALAGDMRSIAEMRRRLAAARRRLPPRVG